MINFNLILEVLKIVFSAISKSKMVLWFHNFIYSFILDVLDCDILIKNSWIVHDVLTATVSAIVE